MSTSPPLLHIVALKFRPELTESRIRAHFEEEVALARRMPELVESWQYGPNTSLISRAADNAGCNWVVICRLFRAADLQTYLDHPQHREVGAIQQGMLLGKFVVDVEVAK